MKEIFGSLAAIVVIIGALPYIRDVLKGETRPSRATWTLLTLLIVLDLIVQHDIGVGWALALTIGEVISTGAVFILAIKYGVGGMERLEIICYVLWATMVACWLFLDRPLLALHFGISADLISLVPTFIKSWRVPSEESKSIFATSAIAGFLGLLAVASFTYEQMLLPIYLLIVNMFTVGILFVAERREHSKINT